MPTVAPFINYGVNFGVNDYFPASGWRAAYSGKIHWAGKFGHYWSAPPIDVKCSRFTISSNGTAETSAVLVGQQLFRLDALKNRSFSIRTKTICP